MKKTTRYTVSDYVIDFLKLKKIDTVFTVSGGGSIFLCDALFRSNVKYICNHHEQASVFAAESYARSKNKTGCALVTTGPGGTNALTGIASAWIDSVPLLVLSGQVFLNQTINYSKIRQKGVQEIDIVSLSKPITKFSKMITNPNDITETLERAYFEASNGRPGPVLVDIPADIQNAEIKQRNKKISIGNKLLKKNTNSISLKVNKLLKLIENSERPLFYFGQGVRISNSQLIAKKIIKKTNIPYCLSWNAIDIFDSKDKMNFGRPGAFTERGSNFIVQNCDLFISVGSRLPYMVTGYNYPDFARNAKKVSIDIDNFELKNHFLKIDLKINSDAFIFFKIFHDKIINKKFSSNIDWINYGHFIRKKFPILNNKIINQNKYVNSYYFIDTLSSNLNKNSTIVTDMGLSFVGTYQSFKNKLGQKIYTNSGHAPMGWGLPAAIGAYYANPKNNIICVTGDGGLQMNIQELATVMHNKIPIKIFIYNNKGYLTIKQTQQLGFKGRIMGSNSSSGLSFPNFSQIAKSHNIKFFKINNHKDLNVKIKKIINSKSPIICELIMDDEQPQEPKMINRRDKDGKSIYTAYEDLYPFIDKKIIENLSFKNYMKKR